MQSTWPVYSGRFHTAGFQSNLHCPLCQQMALLVFGTFIIVFYKNLVYFTESNSGVFLNPHIARNRGGLPFEFVRIDF